MKVVLDFQHIQASLWWHEDSRSMSHCYVVRWSLASDLAPSVSAFFLSSDYEINIREWSLSWAGLFESSAKWAWQRILHSENRASKWWRQERPHWLGEWLVTGQEGETSHGVCGRRGRLGNSHCNTRAKMGNHVVCPLPCFISLTSPLCSRSLGLTTTTPRASLSPPSCSLLF